MIIYTSKNVVGCNISGKIYVHPELHNYPELYKAILKHEKKHTSNSFNRKDLFMDINNTELQGHKKEYYKFIVNHPRTLLGFLPITKIDNKITVDISMLVFWLLTFAIFETILFNI